ncbi:MAG: anthranilate synthase component I [Omnitrophica WOR_2 bacterium RIFCSPHIGHO2_01_FULL_48_9]|nr:MAG: anthranilate synthase component I [Omnitrophica WOR_2 bacterium RIFCSPHIGHO2_01_FULL_48_9]
MLYPSEKEFLKLTKKGDLIPVYREISGDLETPVSAYLKIAKSAKYSFLLESVEGEEKVARFSFLAKNPELILKSKGCSIEITRFANGRVSRTSKPIDETPLTFIREIMAQYKFVANETLPRFCGGMVGYIGYDVVRFFEKLPANTLDDLKIPDMLLILAKDLVIFDHVQHKIKVIACVTVQPKDSISKKRRAYQKAVAEIEQTVTELNKPLNVHPKAGRVPALKIRSNFSESQFKNIVTAAKKDIRDGEIIQVVLSQRFTVKIHTDPFNIYRSLRTLNPSPYMYYLNFDGIKIVGSSPELLVRCEDGIVETRPIAGTRRRGKNESEDAALAQDLLRDPKEKAEHIMLVDLGRNDLGRVCQQGTVKVSEFMIIEKYSHVMHIVSNVKGKLRKDKDSLDVLQAAFPAGTVSGAPKVRAMEIIENLENVARGPYAGCIGYFSFSGNLDTCITIRTIVVKNNTAYVQAGAGIVADSDPKKEYQETVSKAKAQIMAIEKAHQSFS